MLDTCLIKRLLENRPTTISARIAATIGRGRISALLVAQRCGVTVQAVNKWRRSGKISMQHIPVLAELTGLPLDWWLGTGPINGESWGPWPFADWIDYATVASLPAADRRYLALCLRNGMKDLHALDNKPLTSESVPHDGPPGNRGGPPAGAG